MRTLIISDKIDFRLNGLISALSKISEIGHMPKYLHNDVLQYAPDLIVSQNIHQYNTKYLNIHHIDKLDPFINLDLYTEPKIRNEYRCDFVILGSIKDIETELVDIYNNGFSVRHYHVVPENTALYAGYVDMREYYDIYYNSEISIIPQHDIGYRALDIIVAGGRYVKYGENFVQRCINKVYDDPVYSKQEILDKHTNYDRLAYMLDSIELYESAKEIRKIK